MATAVLGSRVRKGSARPFIGLGEGEGELGREQPGQGAKLGEDADSARGATAILVARAGEERGVASSGAPEKVVWGNTRGTQAVWVGRGQVAGTGGRAGVRTPPVGVVQGGER